MNIKEVLNITVFSLLSLYSASSFSDDRANEWYLAKTYKYAVQALTDDFFYAELDRTKGGDINVYIKMYSPEHCRENGEKVYYHDPLNVNGILVQYAQACQGSNNYFYPATPQGLKYVVSEFKRKNRVVFKTTYSKDNIKLIFSAKGFVRAYNKLKERENAI